MSSYILRNIDDQLWAKVKAKAQQQGHPLRWLFLKWLEDYAKTKDKTN